METQTLAMVVITPSFSILFSILVIVVACVFIFVKRRLFFGPTDEEQGLEPTELFLSAEMILGQAQSMDFLRYTNGELRLVKEVSGGKIRVLLSAPLKEIVLPVGKKPHLVKGCTLIPANVDGVPNPEWTTAALVFLDKSRDQG